MAYIKALSYYLPPTELTNDQLQEQLSQSEVSKIAKGIGVTVRHIADEETTAGDMATEAARKMFIEYDVKPEEVDFVIFATQTQDHFLPATACLIQNKLGISTSAGAFDFDLGCSGYVYGLAIAQSFVDSGLAKNVLLLTGDTITKLMHPEDNNRVLFGEAASASLISNNGFAEIGKFEKGTDGRGADCLIVKNRAGRHLAIGGGYSVDNEGNKRRDDYFYMNGNIVFDFTIDRVPKLVKATLDVNGLTEEDINYYVFHQANKFMLNTIRKCCLLPKEKFYVDLDQTGNTTSSTVPIGLKESISKGLIKSGDKVMIAGFGVGLSWAGTVLNFR